MQSFEMYATIKPRKHLLFRFHVGILSNVHSTVMQDISHSTDIRQLQTSFFLKEFCGICESKEILRQNVSLL